MTTWEFTPTCRGFDYFYGYWNAAQDYYSHGGPRALDLHENFATDYTQAGVYSTNLYTQKAQQWVERTVEEEAAEHSFVYLAYQAMHGPIEAPAQYVNSPHCSQVTSINKRNIYCGMMACLGTC
jgi:arylsulfatase B